MSEDLLVRMASAGGRPLAVTTAYTVNRRNFPFFSEWRQVEPGRYAIRYPKEEPFGLAVLWELPGFGRVVVTADNEGRYYRLGQPGLLDFRTEAARSKAFRVARRIENLERGGYVLPRELKERVARAQAKLRLREPRSGDERAASSNRKTGRMPTEPAARVVDEAMCELFWSGEEIELAKARSDIDRMDPRERRAKFFGSSFFDPDAPETFLHYFSELFNFATTPFYRRRVEAVEGQPDWETRDRLLDRLDDRDIARKGHPLSWWTDFGLPPWMKKLSYRTLMEVVYRQVFETVRRYKGRIKIWDVINEAHDPIVKGNDLNLDTDQVFEITGLACRAARDADPEAIRIVNINRPWGVYRSEWEMMNPMHAVEYVEELAARGIEYEILGVQNYHGGPEHYVHDMADQAALIDQYIALGKPIHISEVQTPSSMEADPTKWLGGEIASSGWWHRPWDEETQADWAEQFYTIAASRAQVGAITWWSLSDRQTFWPHGGLLDAHDRPKASYHRLLRFVRGFRDGRVSDTSSEG